MQRAVWNGATDLTSMIRMDSYITLINGNVKNAIFVYGKLLFVQIHIVL